MIAAARQRTKLRNACHVREIAGVSSLDSRFASFTTKTPGHVAKVETAEVQ
jgi:hypothetical protein